MQDYANTAVVVQQWMGNKSSRSMQRSGLLMHTELVCRLQPLKHTMRTGRCAGQPLHSWRQSSRLQEDGSWQSRVLWRSPGLARLRDTCSSLSSAAPYIVPYTGVAGTTGGEDHDQKSLPSQREKDLKQNTKEAASAFIITGVKPGCLIKDMT